MRMGSIGLCVVLLAGVSVAAHAANLLVYDDASENSFNDGCSFGGVPGDFDFANLATVHSGTHSIRFTPDQFNAVSWCTPAPFYSATTDYSGISFWVNLTTPGEGGSVALVLGNSSAMSFHSASLDSLYGSTVPSGTWVNIQTTFASGPIAYGGNFDQISLQDESGGMQANVFFDDVTLLAASNLPDEIFLGDFEGGGAAAGTIVIEPNVTACGLSLLSERYTWIDAAGRARSATLSHNDTGNAGHRGELCDYTYHTDAATVRDVQELTAGGAGGFGYIVSHLVYLSDAYNAAIANDGDDSPLGHSFAGTYTRLFNGRHHAILRFQLNYPRWGVPASNVPTKYNVPVTIDWLIATGRDNPLWSVTFDLSAAPNNAVQADSRAPYGDMAFDGAGSAANYGNDVGGVAWGDHYKFTTTGATPMTLNSTWTWNQPNTIPYVYLWTQAPAPDAEMGIVQSEDITKQDAGSEFSYINWNRTSAAPNAGCPGGNGGPLANYLMPCVDYQWAYQANADDTDPNGGTAGDKHLTWGTGYGFLGTTGYNTDGTLTSSGVGWPRQSYSTYIVLGLHSATATNAQVAQVENAMSSTLTASVGTVTASGPAGVGRSDLRTFQPAGYNRVYGTWEVNAAAGNATLALNASGSGILNPIFVVHNHANALPASVLFDGAALTADVDYFATVDPANADHADTRLWITVNRNWVGSHTLAVQ